MKKSILIIAAAIISMTLNACNLNFDGEMRGGKTIKGNGNIVTQNCLVGTFNELSIALPVKVNFTVSDNYTCAIRVDENIMEYLDIKVKNDDLMMKRIDRYKDITLQPTEFVIEVTAPTLEEISLSGSGTLNVLSPLEGKELEVNVAGSGDITFEQSINYPKIELSVAGSGDLVCAELFADDLEATLAGSGDVKVTSGTVQEAEANVAGSGDIVLTCTIEKLDANIAGSGDIKARVNARLEYTIFGSGNISYYGNPVLKGNNLGHSSIIRLGD